MAYLYGPHYSRIWTQALLLPGESNLKDSIARELAEYLGTTPEAALSTMREVWRTRPLLEEQGLRDGPIDEYYRTHEHGVYKELYRHSLQPDTWSLVSVAALHSAQRFAEGVEILDFGAGPGSTAILFAKHGFRVTLYDISEPMSKVARWRFERRNLEGSFLQGEDLMESGPSYDAIVSLDVLEHIRRPVDTVQALTRLLRPGGLLILNIAFGLRDDTPEHLVPRRWQVLDRIRGLGLQKANIDALQVFYKSPAPGPSLLRRSSDAFFALCEDARASKRRPIAAAARRLRSYELPPVMSPPDPCSDPPEQC